MTWAGREPVVPSDLLGESGVGLRQGESQWSRLTCWGRRECDLGRERASGPV